MPCFNMLSVMACCSLILMLSTRVSLLEFSFPCRAKAVRLILVWCQLPMQHKRKHCEVRPQSVSFFFLIIYTVVISLFGSSPCDVETEQNSSIIICPSSWVLQLSKKVHNTLLIKSYIWNSSFCILLIMRFEGQKVYTKLNVIYMQTVT